MKSFMPSPHVAARASVCFAALIVAALTLTGCAMFKRGGGQADDAVTVAEVRDVISAEEYEARLRERVREELAAEQAESGPGSAELITRRPYHFKEYSEIPGGPSEFNLSFTERDSRTSPYTAEVTYDKIRFTTRLHRDRNVARTDNEFIRDTGRETVSYELRNNEWRRIGSLFVADRTEELVNGEWVAVNEQVVRTIPGEEPEGKGWWGRTWDRITFWN